ncbi:TetR/AcrR family transcriptional regulator [Celeribacter arenosi]|uniref:HTH tetR-type domain-containing protein n=1 Tax=Celeribacter arenosi TaxID=792649 RepID=A0ABP7JVR4_9RHOB
MSSENAPTRIRILKSTVALLESGEGSKVRMSDIAKAAKVSRQAVYLHFPNRAELLTAAARYLDEVNDIEAKLLASRNAATGLERLDAWVAAWGNYIPKIYGMGKALMAMMDTDEEARSAWEDRMAAVHHGCAAAVRDLSRDGDLTQSLSEDEATDLLFSLVSVRTWEQCCIEFGWPQARFIEVMQQSARKALT